MHTTLIIDDESYFSIALKKQLELHCPDILIIGNVASVAEGVSFINEHKPSLIFLDIEMPMEDGFSLFKYFPNPDFDVIFTTAHNSYTIQAIRHSALDYLLKPVNKEELQNSVQRFVEKRQSQSTAKIANLLHNLDIQVLSKQKIAVPVGHAFEFIEFSTIIRAEADDAYTKLFLINGKKILVTKSLNLIDNLLPQELFFRIHRSHIINLLHVKTYIKKEGGTVILADDSALPVALSKKEELFTKLNLKM